MKIRVIITEDCRVQFDFEGFVGESCLEEFGEVLKALEELGISCELMSQTLKPEAWGEGEWEKSQ